LVSWAVRLLRCGSWTVFSCARSSLARRTGRVTFSCRPRPLRAKGRRISSEAAYLAWAGDVTRGRGMRVSRRGAGLLALAALLLPGAAHADELLVMPYTCTMVGGQPLLSPAAERGHRILGPRDQRKFNACSLVNPDLCRQWTVHRFDLDCDGTRVPWVSVVAA